MKVRLRAYTYDYNQLNTRIRNRTKNKNRHNKKSNKTTIRKTNNLLYGTMLNSTVYCYIIMYCTVLISPPDKLLAEIY